MTKQYAEVIGDPIAHSRSPDIHNFWLAEMGLSDRFEYRRRHVLPGELGSYYADRRADPLWRGSNVTIPHKESSARLIDKLGAGEPDFGAVNTVFPEAGGTLVGRNTDVEGVVGPVRRWLDANPDAAIGSLSVAVIGAGGAARAAIYGLKRARPNDIFRILVRRSEQGDALFRQFGMAGPVLPIMRESLAGVDILVNASPLGMTGKPPLDLAPDAMNRDRSLVFDMVYVPHPTPLLRSAKRLGIATTDGYEMLIGQAASAFEAFFGVKVEGPLLAEMHKRLAE